MNPARNCLISVRPKGSVALACTTCLPARLMARSPLCSSKLTRSWASFASRNRVKKLVLGSRSGALGSKAAGVRRPHRRRRPMGHHHYRCLCFPRTFVLFL